MTNREEGRFAHCARGACIISELAVLSAEAVQLAAKIKKNFEELGI